MADREHYANLQPVFSCGLVLIKLEMPLTLPLEFTKTVRKRPLLERLSPASSWSIPMFRAKKRRTFALFTKTPWLELTILAKMSVFLL